MVLIHSMDSDKELQVQTYEEIDAYAVSTTDVRSGIKMKCPIHMKQELLSSRDPHLATLF